MTNNTNEIDAFYSQGNDALTNMFDLSFSNLGASIPATITDDLVYRMTNFSLPEKASNTYDKWYRGHKYASTSGLDADPKTNTFTFRLAKDMKFYKALREIVNISKKTPDLLKAWRMDLSATPIDEEGEPTAGSWTLEGWFPTNVAGITFDQQTGDPLTVQVTGAFFYCIEPTA